MSLTLQSVLTAARDRHPAFHRARVGNAVVARWLSEYVNALIAKCVQRDSRYLMQSASILLALDAANTPSGAGAAADGGGLPGTLDDDAIGTADSTTGSLVEVGLASEDGAVVVVSERTVTSATSTTLTKTAVGRTVNVDVGRVIRITQGMGGGQLREIASNTADTWVVTDAWDTIPDDTSLFEVLVPVYAMSRTVGVATDLPSVSTQTGYLVKTDASGAPYIDYATPLVADIDHGVTLPSMTALIGGTVRYADSSEPLRIVDYAQRHVGGPAVYQVGETVFLCGDTDDWADVVSIEIHYVPVAPELTALTDVLLAPDAAKGCLVAQAAGFMAMRVAGMADVTISAGDFVALGEKAERDYLAAVQLSKRSRTLRVREAW